MVGLGPKRGSYVNGRVRPHRDSVIHIEDRGLQFADSVYEVVVVLAGRARDLTGHLDRLENSAAQMRIAMPMTRAALTLQIAEAVRRNRIMNGLVYLQLTRGQAARDFKFPKNTRPGLIIVAKPVDPAVAHAKLLKNGIGVITTPDLRWARRDIKSTALLAQVMAKQAAVEAGAYEAWMVDGDGYVTEGASSNAWIITADNTLVTRPGSTMILSGVTRSSLFRLAGDCGLTLDLRAFTPAEAAKAAEAMLTAATALVLPVVRIDGQPIGTGAPGPKVAALRAAYLAYASRDPDGVSWQA